MSVYIKLPLIRYCELGLGDIGIYCHDISWQKKISRYYYISRYFIFSQSETNYTIEGPGIILVNTLIATHYMKYIFRL